MKVLHVIPSVGPLRGGPSFVLRTVAAGLARCGVEVHVATTDDNGPERLDVEIDSAVDEDGALYRYFRRQTRPYIVSLPITTWLWSNVANYDLVHIHGVFSWTPNIAGGIARRKGIPYLVRPLGILNRYGMRHRRRTLKRVSFPLCEKPLLEGAAAVQYTSDLEREEAEDLGFSSRGVVIGNPVAVPPPGTIDANAFRRRYPSLCGKTVYLFLSRIDRKKGLDLLIPAFAAFRRTHPDAALVIAGDGDPELIRSLRSDDILWTGFLGGRAKWEALAACDVFVLPSYSENFGVAVVEAMGVGRPVIVSRNVGIQAEIAAVGAGVVAECTVPSLVAALETMHRDERARAACGAAGTMLVRERYSTPAVCSQMLTLYRDILRSSLS